MPRTINRSRQAGISCLPLEIMSYIFRFLPLSDIKFAALACYAWSRAAEDPVLWRNAFISLGTRKERFSNLLVDSLQRRCIQYLKFKHMTTAAQIIQVCKQLGSNLKTLSLQGCRCVNASLLESLSKCCPNILHLDLSRCRQLDVAEYANWLNNCGMVWRDLTVLDLNACKDISDFLVSKIADTLPLIVDLSISGCKGVKASTWKKLVNKAPSLKYLDLSRSDMTDDIMLQFSQLSQLKLKGINLTACKHLTDSGVVSLIQYQTSVEILKLACMDITNTTLSCIGKHMEHLRILDLNSCRQLTDGALSSVTSLLLNLEALNLYSCYQLSNMGLSQFLCWSQGINQDIPLRVLVLNGCSSLSDELVSRFSSILLNLQELDLSSCLHVTDIGLSAITVSLVHLQSLRLSWCINITDKGLSGLVQSKSVPQEQKCPREVNMADKSKKVSKGIKNLGKLQCLDISHCTHITDEGLRSICQLKNLTFLNINMCTQLTDSGLTDVAESLKSLEQLSFSGCTSVTDTGFSSIAIHLERLVAIDASKCDNITDKSILALAKHRHNLTNLDLSMCSQITASAVHQLEISIPGLESLQLRYSGARLSTNMCAV